MEVRIAKNCDLHVGLENAPRAGFSTPSFFFATLYLDHPDDNNNNCTSITEVMSLNPLKPPEFFRCLRDNITKIVQIRVRITLESTFRK